MELILSHVGTDFDGLASMVLASRLYPKAKIVFPGRMTKGVADFYALHRRDFPAVSVKRALAADIQRMIVVDTRSASRLGPFRTFLNQPGVEVHIYDHHPPTAESVVGDQEWVEEVGAAVTLLLERCLSQGIELNEKEATLALIAIHEETGSFRFTGTSPRDLEAAAQLMLWGANLEVVNTYLKDPLDENQRSLLEEYLSAGELLEMPAGRVYLARATRSKSVFGLGLLASRLLEIQGAEAVGCILEVQGQHCSLAARSDSDYFNVSEWAQSWGGGGHRRAAAASRVQVSSEEMVLRLRQLAEKAGTQGLPLARHIMSTEVFTIEQEMTVAAAMEALTAAGHQAATIMGEDGTLLGIVSRTDLGRALEHDLSHAPATSVMTHRVVCLSPDATLEEVRRTVVERGVGTLPIVEGDKIVGIVSRTDLLRDLYYRSEEGGWTHGEQGRTLDLGRLPDPVVGWLVTVASLATELRTRVYAVGGFVRDLLLERPVEDLDFVVEGDAIGLAAELAERLSGTVRSHSKYLTASVRLPDGGRLDLATARRETYCRPAALPEVSQSDLKADLYRRDFTINSLAVRVTEDLQGPVVDFFGGLNDLESRVIRVLHNHSFLDDPTRILRAVRFEQRLNFTIEPGTKHLLSSALGTGIFAMAKTERLREELRLGLSESDPVRVLERLQQLKVLPTIFPGVNLRGKVATRVQSAIDFMDLHPGLVPSEERWLVPLFVLGLELDPQRRAEVTERFGWPVLEWPFDLPETVGRLSKTRDHKMSRAELGALLDRLSPVALVVLASLNRHPSYQQRFELYLKELKGQVPLVTGKDLLAFGLSPGPDLALWKEKAFSAQRNGEFTTRADALEWLDTSLASRSA